jgi:hypothetical protein
VFLASIALTTMGLQQIACSDRHQRHEWLVFLNVRVLSPHTGQPCLTRAASSGWPTLSAILRARLLQKFGVRVPAEDLHVPANTLQEHDDSKELEVDLVRAMFVYTPMSKVASCWGSCAMQRGSLQARQGIRPMRWRSAAADAGESFCHRTSRRFPPTRTSSCISSQVCTDSGLTFAWQAALLCFDQSARAESGRTLTPQERILSCLTCGDCPSSHYRRPLPRFHSIPFTLPLAYPTVRPQNSGTTGTVSVDARLQGR